jgi:AcrR family transcriptional regulator
MSTVSPRRADPQIPAALVEAAAHILAEEGAAALSTRRLAKAVGTSTMAVYTHFGGMDDLIRALVREGFARLNERMTAVGTSADPVADVVALGRAYRQNATDNAHMYAVMFGSSGGAGFALTDEDRQHGRYTLEILVRAVARCMATGRFRPADPQVVAHQMWIAVHGLATLEIGGYLIDPYGPDACLGAQVHGLLLAAGDEPAAAQASIQGVMERQAGPTGHAAGSRTAMS